MKRNSRGGLRVRKKKKLGIVPILLVVLFSGVFVFSAVQLTRILLEYRKGAQEYSSISAVAIREPEQTAQPDSAYLAVDFAALREINPDCIGWIDIPGTKISYPVVQGYDNDEYLRLSFEGNYYVGGSVFIDYLCEKDWSGTNTVVYGHHMYDGTMFSDLAKFMKQNFWESNREVHIYTEQGVRVYDIFSAYRCDVGNGCYTVLFDGDAAVGAWSSEMTAQSRYPTGIEVGAGDKIITLSTCTGESEVERYVVQAVFRELVSNYE